MNRRARNAVLVDAMRWLFAAVLPLSLTSCGEAPVPLAQEAPPAPDAPVEAALSDQQYLVRLGLMRGHLLVGHELYGLDALDASRSHSKHPTDELYAGMEHEFAARQTTGFGDELEAHAQASQGEDGAAVETAYEALTAAIARTEAVVDVSPTMTVEVIVELLREAAFEYGVGIVDGKLSNAHEYQDAYGFTQIALSWAKRAAPHENLRSVSSSVLKPSPTCGPTSFRRKNLTSRLRDYTGQQPKWKFSVSRSPTLE